MEKRELPEIEKYTPAEIGYAVVSNNKTNKAIRHYLDRAKDTRRVARAFNKRINDIIGTK